MMTGTQTETELEHYLVPNHSSFTVQAFAEGIELVVLTVLIRKRGVVAVAERAP